MATVDISSQRASLLADEFILANLPFDLLQIIKNHTSTRILDAVSEAALLPQLTDRIYVYFEDAFADICARWIPRTADPGKRALIISAFARILPFAPYLTVFLEKCLAARGGTAGLAGPSPARDALGTAIITRDLLAAWRLNCFDQLSFGHLTSPELAQQLFSHESGVVRYLAVRLFCQHLHASDAKLDSLVNKYLTPSQAITGDFDGTEIDYIFLSLFERQRAARIEERRNRPCNLPASVTTALQPLSPLVACYGRAMLPRYAGADTPGPTLVMTESTKGNLEQLARMLRKPDPILLYGGPGSGKTALINEIAQSVGAHSSMVTLHLNEQTDAKMLIGLYTTGPSPGSFQWRAGILTTAVREGRWVLIEDLDRAPNEVVSTLLPLVERRELLIPSRGEVIKAPGRFRLFATVRSTRGIGGRATLSPNMLGLRFWRQLPVRPASEQELQQIIMDRFPILHKYVADIIAVYRRLNVPEFSPGPSPGRRLFDCQASPRDLLKWCRRLRELLLAAGCREGSEPVNDTVRERMLMEAVDCFIGSLPRNEHSERMIFGIAEEMRIAREIIEHYLTAYVPSHEESDAHVRIGRAALPKRRRHANGISKSQRPFANTNHAKKLLEQIAVSVKLGEPVLLVGETGIGKTTVIQQLAESLGNKLVAVNLSQQSESADLLGGFKPVSVRSFAVPLKEEFEDLFSATGISASKNQPYLGHLRKCFAKNQWSRVSKLWREAHAMFRSILDKLGEAEERTNGERDGKEQPPKRRRTESKLQSLLELEPRWDKFSASLDRFDAQLSGNSASVAFSFVEGNIVKAARNGDWILLDEINLASPDTLESVSDLLVDLSESPSILLSESGEIDRIQAHPDFRIFGAMNPATDVGKRDLPLSIRSRFTEFYVSGPDRDIKDLRAIVKSYLGAQSSRANQSVDDVARLYLDTKRLAEEKRVVDGAGEVPHFSLRTLARVLMHVNDVSPFYGLRRALFEGFSMGFLTLLSKESEQMLLPLMYHHLLDRFGGPQALLSQTPRHPNDGREYVRFRNQQQDRHYWMLRGDQEPVARTDYIITPYVERNLLNLVRATSTRRFPILIQGPTSAGKTSMIEYLGNYSGNKFVRINNHEHTDLQEYLGTYISGSDGRLRFQEGLLVEAMRKGYWIVLDELNLAPTDVLEALNRLLDDNRELLIPETQEVVKPHENFILFATQNPPSLYGGRKVLSRAFRNRFLELHFDDIPQDELQIILQQRSRHTAPSDCQRIVGVYKELSRLRQTSRLFEQKDSFATLRDLFRWAMRDADNRDQIAANGFMLLAERVRNEDERAAVKSVIEHVFKVTVRPEVLYGPESMPRSAFFRDDNGQGVVWTSAMRRLFILVAAALRNNEPVLLVGETGCGKTTVCQLLAEQMGKHLHIVNAHQNTETGDLIGSQRPVRNRAALIGALEVELRCILDGLNQDSGGSLDALLRAYHSLPAELAGTLPASTIDKVAAAEVRTKALFEWSDGSLVEAMKTGQLFLLDEISLAEDSVLERLNSALEPGRRLLLAEKGSDGALVTASDGFQFLATMNPGGDFGKKELSPALRNRFTEIWVPPLTNTEDVEEIVRSKLREDLRPFGNVIIRFAAWFGQSYRSSSSSSVLSIREILLWIGFVNKLSRTQDVLFAVVHGAATVFVDALGANPSAVLVSEPGRVANERQRCLDMLGQLLGRDVTAIYHERQELILTETELSIGGFVLPRTTAAGSISDKTFAFHAPTTRLNAMRIVRALQMDRPILLEGSPGVGKTTIVAALAQCCGRPLTRINLSDQTDLMDLFGTDVPVEGAEAGHFAWKDAPFLQAMQNGEWVLLDEMNLASQSVLEGLNACLDHRGEVYVAELDQIFRRHPDFRLFAAQNPHHQGGGRKGLPASFVNRFVVVYADVFSAEDLALIANHSFPDLPSELISKLIRFVSLLEHRILDDRAFGAQGSPWEFNLRDILRWLGLLHSPDPLLATANAADFLDLVVRQRFRTDRDRMQVAKLFASVFGDVPAGRGGLYHTANSDCVQVGLALMKRDPYFQPVAVPPIDIRPRLAEIESLMVCIRQAMPCILSGPSGAGKSSLLQYVAAVAGKPLVVFPLNADTDTMDLVGGFEQADSQREVNAALRRLETRLAHTTVPLVPDEIPPSALRLAHQLSLYRAGRSHADAMASSIRELQAVVATDSPISTALADALARLTQLPASTAPRFEWLDGVIVEAVRNGRWLVLDNANLCNASVLDRLNSLLEPNGHLSINEHCEPGGEPRVVQPHPDFRVFLTVDPRHGELSRAMRNRAVEIHIGDSQIRFPDYLRRITAVEGSMQRFSISHLAQFSEAVEMHRLALDHLSIGDLSLLPRYAKAIGADDGGGRREAVDQLVEFLSSSNASRIRDACCAIYLNVLEAKVRGLGAAQTIHPLGNGPVVRLIERDGFPGQPFWIATVQEFYEQLHDLTAAVSSQSHTSKSATLASLNRLQRSFLAKRVPAVSRESSANVSNFLLTLINGLESYLHTQTPYSAYWMVRRRLLSTLCLYLNRTLRLTVTSVFDEAMFQAHLLHGLEILRRNRLLHSEPEDVGLLEAFRTQLDSDFDVGLGLKTGLSMEALWKKFRPLPVSALASIRQSSEIEKLATKLDSLRWKTGSSIDGLVPLQQALSRTYRMVRSGDHDAGALVGELSSELTSLESRIRRESAPVLPFLASEFEALRRIVAIQALQNPMFPDDDYRVLIILSDYPTTELIKRESVSGDAGLLQDVDYILSEGDCPGFGRVTASLVAKLRGTGTISLGSLKLLELELPSMARYLTRTSADITEGPRRRLNDLLRGILFGIISSQQPSLLPAFLETDDVGRPVPLVRELLARGDWLSLPRFQNLCDKVESDHLRQVTADHFVPVLLALSGIPGSTTEDSLLSAIAWTHLGVGAIKLFVPNKPFDPQLLPMLEEQFHTELRDTLQANLSALVGFEQKFTGQGTNLRIQVAEQELAELGEPPKTLRLAYRPPESQLGQIQSIFRNILKIAVDSSVTSSIQSTGTGTSDEMRVVRDNVRSLADRLRANFEAYQDITRPAVGFLRCLELGLAFGREYQDSLGEQATSALLDITPFLGGRMWNYKAEQLPTAPLELFGFLNLLVSVESGLEAIPPTPRLSLLRSIHLFYVQWSKKVEAERKAEEARNRLFRFRGSYEDEEELDEQEFKELFPSYEDDDDERKKTDSAPPGGRHNLSGISIEIADAHRKLFLEPGEPTAKLQELLELVILRNPAGQGQLGRQPDRKILVGAVLAMDNQLASITASDMPGENYDFYQDQNLPEVRRLVAVVERIQIRFRELQEVDEIAHMQPLADVLSACDRVNDLPHAGPLAKILPKVESLHAFVYEWQFGGWARSVHAVPDLHDAVTDTIIRWRRLELSTWARLFEVEARKCRDDAKSWWFVAYELIIAHPLSIIEFPCQLEEYAQSLVRDLETYLSGAIMGQFSARMGLVRQLQKHLAFLTAEYASLTVVSEAVLGFVGYYSRYEKVVGEAIRKARLPIEKTMKDVLLVASWKDTNINALRESARKSHLKLFRIVRKFRAVLGRDVKSLIEKGVAPSDGEQKKQQQQQQPAECLAGKDDENQTPGVIPNHGTTALDGVLPGWLGGHKRLLNVTRTVAVMERTAASSIPSFAAGADLDRFLSDLRESAAELRKETPSSLTEENGSHVKYLKTLKRKLFADTLRGLRDMGFKHSMSVAKLAQQESLAMVFSRTPPLLLGRGVDSEALDNDYHGVLEFSTKVRAAARSHSGDLTEAEVGRSIGYFEAILHMVLGQRRFLATGAKSISRLDTLVGQVRCLAGDSGFEEGASFLVEDAKSDWTRVLYWLSRVVDFGRRFVQIHGRMGGCDNGPVVESLGKWAERFALQRERARAAATLPSGLVTRQLAEVGADFKRDLDEFGGELRSLAISWSGLAFILDQIAQWTSVREEDGGVRLASPAGCDLKVLADDISDMCDRVLVAFEKLAAESATNSQSAEQSAWFVAYDSSTRSAMRALHVETIAGDIEFCLNRLRKVDGLRRGETIRAASGLFTLAWPILAQYAQVCRQRLTVLLEFHHATVRTCLELSQAFVRLAADGFCTPPEKSDESSGKDGAGKLEDGTGLGDGEGENDISKDIKQDEDLSELAQEANKEPRSEEMEDVEDAVDMAGEDMEGEMGSEHGEDDKEGGSDKEDEEEDMDEEAGDVDDLDPTAVDEKMWDGDGDKTEKEQKGHEEKGKKDNTKQVAAEAGGQGSQEDNNQEQEPEPEPADEITQDAEDIRLQPEETNLQDQNVPENDALALPEDMELDMGEESEGGDSDDLDKLSDMGGEEEENDAKADGEVDELDSRDEEHAEESKPVEEMGESDGENDLSEEAGGPPDVSNDAEEEPELEPEPEPEPDGSEALKDNSQPPQRTDDAKADAENVAPSDVRGSGQDSAENEMDIDDGFREQAANDDGGNQGQEMAPEEDRETAGQGTGQAQAESSKQNDDRERPEDAANDPPRQDPFRKLGDVLERWYCQQRRQQIREAETDLSQDPRPEQEGIANRDFQHLPDESARHDAQALGAAREEEVRPFDDVMAIDEDDEQEQPTSRIVPEGQDDDDEEGNPPGGDANGADSPGPEDTVMQDRDDMQFSGVKTRKGAFDREASPSHADETDDREDPEREEEEEQVQEASVRLETTHLEERELRNYGESLRQWASFQSNTHALSVALTAQLRLILTPSQATKLSGSFRTGKRLNIKRIIPYIASEYRRDKIWMRRSVPTKRAYQILLCVDDSRSMGGESRSGELALESLVMVARALAMLEAGQVGVLGFGGDVFSAHDFGGPALTSHDAGARVLQQFTFRQDRTDIALLIRSTIDRFRAARQQQQSSAGAAAGDLWQLALILSDGLTPSSAHESIRRLLREAMEERVMVVFIVMDDIGGKEKTNGNEEMGDSVLNLREARFVQDGQGGSHVVIERYLDTFPFQYYLIVHGLEDLPGALAGLLRTWFAEVNS